MEEFSYNTLVQNIKNLIQTKGYKQGVVAQRAHFTESEFSNMLNERRKLIRAEHLPRIAHALEIEINELFKTDESN